MLVMSVMLVSRMRDAVRDVSDVRGSHVWDVRKDVRNIGAYCANARDVVRDVRCQEFQCCQGWHVSASWSGMSRMWQVRMSGMSVSVMSVTSVMPVMPASNASDAACQTCQACQECQECRQEVSGMAATRQSLQGILNILNKTWPTCSRCITYTTHNADPASPTFLIS